MPADEPAHLFAEELISEKSLDEVILASFPRTRAAQIGP